MKMVVPSILESVDENLLNSLPSVSDRYFEHKYCKKSSLTGNAIEQRISFHSNRICMISLADKHPVIKDKKEVKKVNFSVSECLNRLDNAASGKGKRGAQKLFPESLLCFVECEDGASYPVYSCIRGKLVEMNSNLIENPNLLVEKPKAEGYIALVLPILATYEQVKASMLTEQQYLECN